MSHNTPNHRMRIAGQTVGGDRTGERCSEVMNPFTGQCIASVPKATLADVRQAFAIGHAYNARLSRYERSAILKRSAALVRERTAAIAATNKRMVLKPSEKVPLSALLFADLLYEAGPPPEMLSVVLGNPREIADELVTNAHVDLVTFTGGVTIGKAIAARAGYRRMVLKLGGNDPIIVMDDADLDEAATLAVQGSHENSGQRCTAVKRLLKQRRKVPSCSSATAAAASRTRAWATRKACRKR